MALESATYISDLVSANPSASDGIQQGDDHIRLIKAALKATFPNVSGAVTGTQAALNSSTAAFGTGGFVILTGTEAGGSHTGLRLLPPVTGASGYAEIINAGNESAQVCRVGITLTNVAQTVAWRAINITYGVGTFIDTHLDVSGDIAATGPIAGSVVKQAGTALLPPGCIVLWSGSVGSIPAGWALCNGANGTPDLRDRFVVGAGGGYSPAATGGSNSVSLSTGNLPAHSHGINDPGHTHGVNDPSHSHAVLDPGHHHDTFADAGWPYGPGNDHQISSSTHDTDQGTYWTGTSTTGIQIYTNTTGISLYNATTGITTQNTGSGASIDIRPQYYALAYIMRLT